MVVLVPPRLALSSARAGPGSGGGGGEGEGDRKSPDSEMFYFVQYASSLLANFSRGNKYLQLKWDKSKDEEHNKRSVTKRDNCLLLEKMSCIMRTKGQIDNKNYYKTKSLNGEKKQELPRVNQEYRAILDRITKSQPQYQVQQWHEDWQAEKYMANIARYPHGRCKS
ncbi:LOW QUALITY PROTEIN: uncharacterized protein CFAP97D2 [Aegotheles albertisi]